MDNQPVTFQRIATMHKQHGGFFVEEQLGPFRVNGDLMVICGLLMNLCEWTDNTINYT
jgi:hypothetical protein